MMENKIFEGSFQIVGGDFTKAGVASTEIKSILMKLGCDEEIIRRVAIAAFEAEMNIIIYATAGFIRFSVTPEEVCIIADDMGPGIADVELAMQEGYSTAPDWVREMGWGAGMGLPNMKKNSDIFKIDTVVGEGTRVEMIFKVNSSCHETE